MEQLKPLAPRHRRAEPARADFAARIVLQSVTERGCPLSLVPQAIN